MPKPSDRWANASGDEIREFQERVPAIKAAALRLHDAFAELYFRVGGISQAESDFERALMK